MASFGRFTLRKQIGIGGMAEIYLAEVQGQRCVIKRMLPHLASKPEFVDMFLTEADICTFLRHENLIEVYEAAEIDGVYYMAMEYAQGFELERFLEVLRENEIECPAALVVSIGRQIAKALDYLHRATSLAGTPLNLVHRDVNPTNVFVLDGGDVKLGDLGVARVGFLESFTASNAPLKGKLRYLAPELLLKKDADQRLDVYCLGITLWEIASGLRAFDLRDDLKTMQAIVDGDLPRLAKIRPELPKALVQVIERAISVDPAKRHATAADLYRDLRGLAEHGENYTQEQLAGMVEYAHELAGDVAAVVSAVAGEPAPPPPTHTHEMKAPGGRDAGAWLLWAALAAVVGMGAVLTWKIVTLGRHSATATVGSGSGPASNPAANLTAHPHPNANLAVAPTVAPSSAQASNKPAAPFGAPNAGPNIKAAFGLLKKGHAEKAAMLFEQALKMAPERADARYGLARAYLDLGRNDEALQQAQLALENRQSDPDVWLMVGTAAQELGRIELARQAYERFLALAPNHPSAEDVRAVMKTLQK